MHAESNDCAEFHGQVPKAFPDLFHTGNRRPTIKIQQRLAIQQANVPTVLPVACVHVKPFVSVVSKTSGIGNDETGDMPNLPRDGMLERMAECLSAIIYQAARFSLPNATFILCLKAVIDEVLSRSISLKIKSLPYSRLP